MENNKIDYIELHSEDLEKTKKFYGETFGWEFTDYGEEYTSFSKTSAGINGGFAKVDKLEGLPADLSAEASAKAEAEAKVGPLVILYHKDLEEVRETVTKNGGVIHRDIFSFPGGRRFHFTDPTGNKLAVWSNK